MWYVKNLPRWERAFRFVAAALMGSCAWHYGLTPVGAAFGIAALVSTVTALVGYCPMCAVAGRRLPSKKASDGLR